MPVVDARTWIEHLSIQDCWELLDAAAVGRVGVIIDDAPVIFPVNYVVDDRSIVFRTDPGAKLDALGRTPSVCFEVDETQVVSKTGWSVLVKGQATEITTAAEARSVADLSLEFWTIGPKTHWVRITPGEVTGRRVHAVLTRG